ncbi:hypothetical protein [Oceanobacillus sojae]|uniref:hypothetical protein n=1 Tax=Oceanobacillus sojae TaxID=582851 RepID=UPI000ADDF6C5
MRKRIILFICIAMISLVACRQQNELFNNENITSIEIQNWDNDELVSTVTDEALINDLIEELESANSSSTANIDIPGADYRLLFSNDDKVVQELGYYIEEKNFNGTTGQFIDMEAGNHYGVTKELPVTEEK